MLRRAKSPAITALILCLALETAPARAADSATVSASVSPRMVYEYHAVVPLGQDGLLLQPARKGLLLLASAESTGFEGWRRVENGARPLVYTSNGTRVRRYPEFVDFRITASTRWAGINFPESLYPTACHEDLNDYLLGLRFRLKVFNGLNTRIIEPKVVRQIGVPPDVPYDERIYRISFKLEDIPLEDRIMLEVLSPGGERISKFHLEFN